mmetsp:Transcript_13627/g.29603  ORF Transcript_13627/g.29603 Transcript_13627/m.29603 type:complete len:588 (-) Transcript_13627:117-1880(-)
MMMQRRSDHATESRSTSSSNVTNEEDEISAVLRHFKSKAEFLGWDRVDRQERRAMGGGDRMRIGRTNRRAHVPDRGYSAIRYMKEERKLRLSYQHCSYQQQQPSPLGCVAFVKFDVSIDRPVAVMCICCNSPDTSGRVRRQIDEICRTVSTTGTCIESSSANGTSSATGNASLFSVVSRLLQLLNRGLPQALVSACAETADAAENGGSGADAVLRREVSYQMGQKSTASSSIRTILGLEMLLLRSAAAGRNRATLCSPIPVEYSAAMGGDADVIANCIFATTDRMGLGGKLVSRTIVKAVTDADTHQHNQQLNEEQTLLAFLLSLSWTEGELEVASAPSDVDAVVTSTITDNKSSNNRKKSMATIRLCLDTTAALGDASPRFDRLAKRRGVVTAYHGTKIENAWSVLNYGLQNLSYHNTLSANGAMMGTGVYLSTAYDVAAFFAKNDARSTPALMQAWRHPAVLSLIQYACAGSSPTTDSSISGTFWDEYTVACYPVFEAAIIAPPESNDCVDDEDCTRREGKYYVVPNSDNIRITKLHLTMELKKKRTAGVWWWPPGPLLSAIVLCVAVWILSRISEEAEEDEHYY